MTDRIQEVRAAVASGKKGGKHGEIVLSEGNLLQDSVEPLD